MVRNGLRASGCSETEEDSELFGPVSAVLGLEVLRPIVPIDTPTALQHDTIDSWAPEAGFNMLSFEPLIICSKGEEPAAHTQNAELAYYTWQQHLTVSWLGTSTSLAHKT